MDKMLKELEERESTPVVSGCENNEETRSAIPGNEEERSAVSESDDDSQSESEENLPIKPVCILKPCLGTVISLILILFTFTYTHVE